jgi:N-methylhydantoinase A
MMNYLGVDTGGTFTDFVLFTQSAIRTHKVLSTPDAPERAILEGIAELGLEGQPLLVIHGSTVATNAVLEGKGVRTALVTNKGFADVLTIGRQNRRALYALQPDRVKPPVASELCLEIDCRLAADGQWLTRLDQSSVESLVERLQQLQVRAVAINLLFSYLDPEAEQQIAQAINKLPGDLFVSLSSEVLAQIGEYERGVATWLNAWVGPLIKGYVNRLQQGLPVASLSIMQSSGETMAAGLAAQQAVRMLLSGPAGGLVGARFTAGASGFDRLMTFDMGGTSSDVALLDGDIHLTSRGRLADYPVAVPMVDMHTIGAGGGSLAYLDEGGMLQVGPESAGASPGPACYSQGGNQATVTDANLVLGRLPSGVRLGGNMALDRNRALRVVSELAEQMNVSVEEAAAGIIHIANEHMARALRVISVQKGYDPREFILVSFGGAGGLHVCALAEALGMRHAMVPAYAGVLSALGMLATAPGRQLSRSVLQLLEETDQQQLLDGFDALARQGIDSLECEQIDADAISRRYSLDLRYRGQSNTLNVEWVNPKDCAKRFHVLHEQRYGHALAMPVELVNLRVSLIARGLDLQLPQVAVTDASSAVQSREGVELIEREKMPAGRIFNGPMIIIEAVATIWIETGWQCQRDLAGNLLLKRIA